MALSGLAQVSIANLPLGHSGTFWASSSINISTFIGGVEWLRETIWPTKLKILDNWPNNTQERCHCGQGQVLGIIINANVNTSCASGLILNSSTPITLFSSHNLFGLVFCFICFVDSVSCNPRWLLILYVRIDHSQGHRHTSTARVTH